MYFSNPGWISRSFLPQSGETRVEECEKECDHQQMSVISNSPGYVSNTMSFTDVTRRTRDNEQAPLGDFLSRPLRIVTQDWPIGSSVSFSFNPWALFLTNKRVINRINNFNLLRCRLVLNFVVNGNSFLYGRLIAYYRPLGSNNTLHVDSPTLSQDIVQGSQCPRIFIDPCTSTAGEMMLPFFYYKDYMSIPSTDWNDMGFIHVRTLVGLKHANGATGSTTITVFCHAEDVELCATTTANTPAIVPQMGEFQQANATGMISGPATAVAKVAGALKSVPLLKPYALASELIAMAVAKAATIFGYSRPTVTRTPMLMAPRGTGSLALTNVADNSQKLTIDAQQELTIDPRIAGIGPEDTLSIKSIASRESYLTTFSWNIGTAVDTRLWNCVVNPLLWAESPGQVFHLTACAMASLPFQYWTGSMKYRFQVVCSNFHRGRLRVTWDPATTAPPEFNTTYQRIVDLSEEKDFEVTISNGQPYTLLSMPLLATGVAPTVYSDTSAVTYTYGNGVLGVYVLNALTTPNTLTNNDIRINVFVAAGDDFEVYVPNDRLQKFTFAPQSGEVDETDQFSRPVMESAYPIYAHNESDMLNRVFTGESIASFRTLLKRFMHHRSIGTIGTSDANIYMTGRFPAFPFFRGRVPGAVGLAQGTPNYAYNYCQTTLLNWITPCFAGWRGSMRWKFVPRHNWNGNTAMMYATRSLAEETVQFEQDDRAINPTLASRRTLELVALQDNAMLTNVDGFACPTGALGTAYVNHTNSTLEVEIPYYSRVRFIPWRTLDTTSGTLDALLTPLKCIYNLTWTRVVNRSAIVDLHVAAGDDFQTYFWTGPPRLYREGAFPTPV